MNQLYDPYFRRFGVRKITQLMSPPLPSSKLLDLPLGSIYHYLGSNSGVDVAPSMSEYLFRNITQPIAMEHILENGAMLGSPQHKQTSIASEIQKYHSHHRRYHQVRDIGVYENTPKTLVVENYGFISTQYKYARNVMTNYYSWYNQQAALWNRIALLSVESARHQFITVRLPTTLPSRSDMSTAAAHVSSATMRHMPEVEAFFILELWKWLGEWRQQSLISKVPYEGLSKVNIIFEESGRWMLLNLGLLNSWRKSDAEEEEKNPKANKFGIDPHQLERRFVHTLMTLFQARSVDGKGIQGSVEAKQAAGSDEAVVTKLDPANPSIGLTGTVTVPTNSADITPNAEDILNADAAEHTTLSLTEMQERHLEADLAELDRISKAAAERRMQLAEVMAEDLDDPEEAPSIQAPKALVEPKGLKTGTPPVVEAVAIESDHVRGIRKIIDRYAEQGILSAAEARRYAEMAKRHEVIDAPDGKGTLAEYVVIKPEHITVKATAIPDKPTIIDKSMLHSSLHDFDPQYIDNVFHRDVAAMVLKIQDAGICVTDYEVERVHQITGDFDTFTCRVTPIEGAPGTLRWKLPAIRPDGVYVSNGVPYRMRKQKGDLPIRKLSPNRVGLTSYYGKVFVSRSEKKVNDYADWLRRNIMAAGLGEENKTVTGLQPGNMFDPAFEAPRLYTTLATGFRGFNVAPASLPEKVPFHTLFLVFDHRKRHLIMVADEHDENQVKAAEQQLKKFEANGDLLIGKTNQTNPILMRKTGEMYVIGKEKLVPLGPIENLLGLDGGKAPDEFVELKVLGTTIPVGVVLAYEMGLSGLMHRLSVEPRRVPAGKRVNLLATEYSLVFSDETLVFEKKDKFAAIILAGFQEYHRAIRQYSVYEFDRRGVYLNVLEAQGIGARYLREVDLLNQLWVEPITKEILVEMREPVDFQQLLLRAADMLLWDQHPRTLDASYQRIKGYERMAGAVYSELIKAIRIHNGKPGKSKLPIDMSPFEVWKNISEDPSKAQVKDINPIENLKQQEAVTYSGVGGRNSRSMVKNTRAYDENDMGVISESTVDSSDVAVNTYLSANPLFTSVRGVSSRYDVNKAGVTSLLSTSALSSVGADRDDQQVV